MLACEQWEDVSLRTMGKGNEIILKVATGHEGNK